MKARNSIIVGALVVASGLFAWRMSRQPLHQVPAREQASETTENLSALRAELHELRARQDQEVRLLGAQAVSTTAAPTAGPPEAPLTEQEATAKAEKTNARIADVLTRKIHSERVDVDWSATASAQIQTAFKTVRGSEVMDAQCASTLCRVVVRHVEKGDQFTIAEKLARQEPFDQGTFYRYDRQSDPPTTTMFVLRDGQVPPEVNNL